MSPVGRGVCDECEVCATAPGDGSPIADAEALAAPSRSGRRGRRRRSPCPTCGHPRRLHGPTASGHEPVVGYPLPSDVPTDLAPPRLTSAPAPEPATAPVDDAAAGASTPAAVEGETFVDRIRALTELYRAGLLDDDEFAAAKAVVLRDQTP